MPWQCCVAFTASICEYTLGNYGHARIQGGRQPAAAKSPCMSCNMFWLAFWLTECRLSFCSDEKRPVASWRHGIIQASGILAYPRVYH